MSQTPAALLAAAAPADLPALATLLVLGELARSDGDHDAREQATIDQALASVFGLDPDRVQALVASQAGIRAGAPDLAALSRLLLQHLPRTPDREAVVTAMWSVVLADGEITAMEDRLAASLSTLLGVDFKRIDEIKAALRDA